MILKLLLKSYHVEFDQVAEQESNEPDDADENIPEVEGEPVTPETLKELGVDRPMAPDPNTPLDELLEAERITLMQICSMMRCLKELLLYSDDDDGTMHSDVADVSSRLLDDSISRLEVIKTWVKQRLEFVPRDQVSLAE